MQTMAQPEIGKLKQLRLEVGYTQEGFAIGANLRVKTYRIAEQKGSTSYPTAKSILQFLNDLRSNRQLPPIELDDLGLNIT